MTFERPKKEDQNKSQVHGPSDTHWHPKRTHGRRRGGRIVFLFKGLPPGALYDPPPDNPEA